MLRLGALLLVVSLAWLANSQPIDSEDGWVRVQRSALPGRMMMVRNYVLRQPYGSSYDHQAAMSSFAAGSLATGSYIGRRRNQLVVEKPEDEEKEEDMPTEKPEEEKPAEEEEEEEEEKPMEEVEKKKPKVTRVVPKAPKVPKRRAMADEDEDEDESPRSSGRKNEGIPTYSNFFPIVFSGGSRGGARRRSSGGDDAGGEEEGGNPGLIAISNSFSNGRGAIASSTATAYGGPAPAVRAANQQYRKSSPSRYSSS